MARRDRIALVVEEVGKDEHGPLALGRFWVRICEWPEPVHAPTREHPDEGPRDVSLEDALAWGRERAARVEVRLAGEHDDAFTAGEIATVGRPLREAPSVDRRRTPGWEFVDHLAGGEVILWDVLIDAHAGENLQNGWEGPATPERRRWADALAATAGCETIAVLETYSSPLTVRNATGQVAGRVTAESTAVAIVRLEARSAARAATMAAKIAREASAATEWAGAPRFTAKKAYPSGSQLAGWNAHL